MNELPSNMDSTQLRLDRVESNQQIAPKNRGIKSKITKYLKSIGHLFCLTNQKSKPEQTVRSNKTHSTHQIRSSVFPVPTEFERALQKRKNALCLDELQLQLDRLSHSSFKEENKQVQRENSLSIEDEPELYFIPLRKWQVEHVEELNTAITNANSQELPELKDFLKLNYKFLGIADHLGKYPLHYAVGTGRLDLVRFMITDSLSGGLGTDMNCQDLNGQTVLHQACEQDQIEMIYLLLSLYTPSLLKDQGMFLQDFYGNKPWELTQNKHIRGMFKDFINGDFILGNLDLEIQSQS